MKKAIIKKTILIVLFISILVAQFFTYKIWNSQKTFQNNLSESIALVLQPNIALTYSNEATKSYIESENHFNEYIQKRDPQSLIKYQNALETMGFYLDSLNKVNNGSKEFSSSITNKNKIELEVIQLKKQLDQLINQKLGQNKNTANLNFNVKKFNYDKVLSSISYDTVKKVTETKKKGLFGRIGNALKGKTDVDKQETQSVIKMVFNNQEKTGSFEDQLRNTFKLSEKYYIDNFNQIKATYNTLKDKDYELLEVNKKIQKKNQELLLSYSKSAQETTRVNFEQAIKEYQHENSTHKNTIFTLLMLMGIATILLLSYTIYSYLNHNKLAKAKELAEKNLDTKNQLMGMLSHEMRAPLSIISNFSRKLKTKNSNTELDPIINSLHFASSSLQITVSQILDFFKNENSKLKLYNSKINLKKEIKPILESLSSLSEDKNIQIISNIDKSIDKEVWADNVKIHQLFYNIIVNAIKFTNQGSITVNTKLSPYNDKYRLDVSITDTGVGIPEEDIKNVFDKFYQSNTHNEQISYGAGLGLNLCKDIIELFSGEITIKSKINVGTEISFYLILEPSNAEQETFQNQLQSKFKDQKIKIAVVDDDTLTLKVIQKLLTKVGFEVNSFERAPEIKTFLKDEIVDVILTDIHIFDYSGIELSKYIKAINNENKSKPIIALTGDTYIGTSEIKSLGFDEILVKPVNKEEFYQKLLYLLSKS